MPSSENASSPRNCVSIGISGMKRNALPANTMRPSTLVSSALSSGTSSASGTSHWPVPSASASAPSSSSPSGELAASARYAGTAPELWPSTCNCAWSSMSGIAAFTAPRLTTWSAAVRTRPPPALSRLRLTLSTAKLPDNCSSLGQALRLPSAGA
ncbi:Uncharacterised protein [Bordetella pertussis]|nr:Uncharacterised protein [Bordetella pertussis]CPP26513.1 Uncharacterised protein [Bordetella pertussis]CPP67615.1 Uncharacterised protein [Bordetella pertussis]CPP80127.1 Uncharacterised protein [Bordetella pertussis]CRE16631.1 Uncharacterised protein [Bordetella pertussis]